jgi:peptidoglycan/LPS O-acetylase OafA/YrhL
MGTAPARAAPMYGTKDPATARDIPSLDGLRAVSIAIVILAHTRSQLPPAVANSAVFRYAVGGGLHGVQVFFAISGYLITTLLLREFDRKQTISLSHFYIRRSLRILPPFYIYLAALGLLWVGGVVPEHATSFLAAATYGIVYLPDPQGWCVFHTWSLSIEEQFYLFWPLVFLLAHRRGKGTFVALLLLAVMPFVRIALWFALPHPGGIVPHSIVTVGSIDILMIGCLLALIKDRAGWRRVHRFLLQSVVAASLFLLGFLFVPRAGLKLAGSVAPVAFAAYGATITALCIGGILVHVVGNPHAIAGRFLNLAVVRHVGVISYSLYLWQQLFTIEGAHLPLYNYLLMLLAAEASYRLIEKPVLRFRNSLRL